MKHILSASAAAAALLGAANAAVVETGAVAIDGSDTVTQTVLATGVEYTLTISGSFFIGGPGDGLADAEYFDLTDPQDGLADGFEIGVAIDGVDVDFGDFDATSTYQVTLMGMGAAIALSFVDSFYGDNSGSLSFTLETADIVNPVPVPAAALLMVPALALGAGARRRAARSAA